MTAIDEQHAGTASGIINAVARVAGLLAIAIFGMLMLKVYAPGLGTALRSLPLPPSTRQAVLAQATRLAGFELPTGIDPAVGAAIRRASAEAFVGGFRVVMFVSSLLPRPAPGAPP
jgi:hypothetical protein